MPICGKAFEILREGLCDLTERPLRKMEACNLANLGTINPGNSAPRFQQKRGKGRFRRFLNHKCRILYLIYDKGFVILHPERARNTRVKAPFLTPRTYSHG